MHSKELIEIVKKKRASSASYGIIAQEIDGSQKGEWEHCAAYRQQQFQ